MKYKNQLKRAENRKNWWDKRDSEYQHSTTRPGSQKSK